MRYSSLRLVAGKYSRNWSSTKPVLVRVEVSDLQDLLDLADARVVEHVK